jgi:hypothetical protein
MAERTDMRLYREYLAARACEHVTKQFNLADCKWHQKRPEPQFMYALQRELTFDFPGNVYLAVLREKWRWVCCADDLILPELQEAC